jgi:2'-hydroxyisoflavone reductase
MRWLVIGGTRFVGHHIVQAALAAGAEITLFNRGRSASALPPGVTLITGDRRADLGALRQAEQPWDVVVDCCAYLPSEAAAMAVALRGRVGLYVLISSVSVYASFVHGNDEDSALARIEDPETRTVDGRTYGALKALCESAVLREAGVPVCFVRPGLVVGPQDPTQRFTYWPARVGRARDGELILAPGRAADGLQFIDARDLAAFVVNAACDGLQGSYNVLGTPGSVTVGSLLQACAKAACVHPQWLWCDATAAQRIGLRPWVDLPAWAPAEGDTAGFARVSNAKALAAGLKLRPVLQTVADTLAWHRSLPVDQQGFTLAGMSPEREREALVALTAAGCRAG